MDTSETYWTKLIDSDGVVHKSGDEVIEGIKTLRTSQRLSQTAFATTAEIRNPSFVRNVLSGTNTGSSDDADYSHYTNILFGDGSDNPLQISSDGSYIHGRLGQIEHMLNSVTGQSRTLMSAYRFFCDESNCDSRAYVMVGFDGNDSPAYINATGRLALLLDDQNLPPDGYAELLTARIHRDPSTVTDAPEGWGGNEWVAPIHVVGSSVQHGLSVRLGSTRGNTYVTSGESYYALPILDKHNLSVQGNYEDILLVSDSDVIVLTGVNQDTGKWTGKMRHRLGSTYYDSSSVVVGTAPPANKYSVDQYRDYNEVSIAETGRIYNTDKTSGAYFNVWNRSSASSSGSRQVGLYYNTSSAHYEFRPSNSDVYLGAADTYRWKQLYATTTTISTSDERLKDEITEISDDVLDAWNNVKWCDFKFKDAIEEKGSENARLHAGIVAQQVQQAFANNDLSAEKYAFFCYDEWNAVEDEYRDGELYASGRPAGNQYSIRYEEALCIEAAYQRRRASRAENRIAALEEEVSSLKSQISQLINR